MRYMVIVVLMLTGCATRTITEYVEVEIPVEVRVKVDKELTEREIVPLACLTTWGDVSVLALENQFALGRCNLKLEAIDNLK